MIKTLGAQKFLSLGLLGAALLLILLRAFFLISLRVQDNSLAPWILPGDRLLVWRFGFFGFDQPEEWHHHLGKLLVFRHPHSPDRLALLQLTALPGSTYQTSLNALPLQLRPPKLGDSLEFEETDALRMDWAWGLLEQERNQTFSMQTVFLLDGQEWSPESLCHRFGIEPTTLDPLLSARGKGMQLEDFISRFRAEHPEFYLLAKRRLTDGQREFLGVRTQNHYFALGSPSLHTSWDSRYWGFVAQKYIYGRPLLVLFSQKPKGGLRWNRIFKKLP